MARRTHTEIITTDMSTVRIETVGTLRTMFLDDAESTAIDLNDPQYLEFEYMQHIHAVVTGMFSPDSAVRMLHLGGAGCALARCFADIYPRARQLAIEIDPQLAVIAREHFDLPTSPALRIRTQDARQTLDTNANSWHVIIRDTFDAGRVPQHMATAEAYAHASRLLQTPGVYCVNIAGERGLDPLAREVRAVQESFDYYYAIADPAIAKNRRYGNIVLLGSHAALDVEHIDRSLRKLAMPARLISMRRLEELAYSSQPLRDSDVGWPPVTADDAD